MDQDINLFIIIAQIAGVFVGFGALISVTRRSDIEVAQLVLIRSVVTTGLIVIIAALIPVGLSRYGLSGHTLWAVCSLAFLVFAISAVIYFVGAIC